jgi:hypothetical protein
MDIRKSYHSPVPALRSLISATSVPLYYYPSRSSRVATFYRAKLPALTPRGRYPSAASAPSALSVFTLCWFSPRLGVSAVNVVFWPPFGRPSRCGGQGIVYRDQAPTFGVELTEAYASIAGRQTWPL